MDLISIIVIQNNLVIENHIAATPESAEAKFLEICRDKFEDFDTHWNHTHALDDGYAYGNFPDGDKGSISINWPERVQVDRTPLPSFRNAHHWLLFHAGQPFQSAASLMQEFITKLDSDDIQDVFQSEMDADGYFD